MALTSVRIKILSTYVSQGENGNSQMANHVARKWNNKNIAGEDWKWSTTGLMNYAIIVRCYVGANIIDVYKIGFTLRAYCHKFLSN